MEAEDIFFRYVGIVADEWDDGKHDWPRINTSVETLYPDDIEQQARILAFLIGLRAAERKKDSPKRLQYREEILGDLRFAEGFQKISYIRREAKAYAMKRADQIQSKLILGFFLSRNRHTVSKSDLNIMLEAIEYVWSVRGDRPTKLSKLYGQFRSRVTRLIQNGGDDVEADAKALFDRVDAIVIEYLVPGLSSLSSVRNHVDV